MRKLIKITLASLISFILLISAILLFTAYIIPTDTMKTTIIKQVYLITGQQLNLQGKLYWSFYPWLELTANDLSLRASDKPVRPTAKAKKLQLQIKILPLFQGHLVIKKVVLDHLHLNLSNDVDDPHNWRKIFNPPTISSQPQITTKANTFSRFEIGKLLLNDSSITWETTTNNPAIKIQGLNFSGSFDLQPPTDMNSTSSWVNQLALQGKLTIQQIKGTKLKAENLKAKLITENGHFKIQNIKAQLYQGNLFGEATFAFHAKKIGLITQQTLINVQASDLFNDLAYTNRIHGSISANLKLHSEDLQNLLGNLNGEATILVKDGSITGINILRAIEGALAIIQQRKLDGADTHSTPFYSITGRFQIKQGIVNNQDLFLDSPTLKARASGQANLVSKTFACTVNAKILDKMHPELTKLLDSIGGSIPLKIYGTFSEYKVVPDSSVITKAVTRQLIQKKLDTIIPSNNKPSNILKDVIKGFPH